MEKGIDRESKEMLGDIVERLIRIEDLIRERPLTAAPEEDLLTAEQVASMLDLSMSAVYANVSQKRIPAYKKGKRLYFDRAEILAWQKSNKKTSREEVSANVDAFYRRKMTRRR